MNVISFETFNPHKDKKSPHATAKFSKHYWVGIKNIWLKNGTATDI